MSESPEKARDAVLVKSHPEDTKDGVVCRGHDFNQHARNDIDALLASYRTTGFQATALTRAIDEINKMLTYSALDDDGAPQKCTIFLGYFLFSISLKN